MKKKLQHLEKKLEFISGDIEYTDAYFNLYFQTCKSADSENEANSQLSKLEKVKFALSSSFYNMDEMAFNGLLGLAYSDKTNMLLNQMYYQGLISERIMGLNIPKDTKSRGRLRIGDVDPRVSFFSKSILWLKLNSHSKYWSVENKKSFLLVQRSRNSIYKMPIDHSNEIIFDSGSSFIYLHHELFDLFIKNLTQFDLDCELNLLSEQIECTTSEDLSKNMFFEIQLQDKKIKIYFETILESLNLGKKNIYKLKVLPIFENMVLFGLSFLKNYYTIFDMDRSRIGFLDSQNLIKKEAKEGNFYLFGSIGVYFLIILAIWLSHYKNRKLFNRNHSYQLLEKN